MDDAWMDDVSPAREVNRTAAATTQSESSVLSESVSDQELEETEAEEEDGAADFHEEGFDLDHAEPLFANNRDDDDWEDSDSDASEADALFSEAAADDLESSDWDVDDEEERPELEDWDDEEEDNNVFLSDVSEPGEVMEEREPTENEMADIASEESAKEGLQASDNDADWDNFEDDQPEPVLGDYAEEEDSEPLASVEDDEGDDSVETEEDAGLEAVNFEQGDADADPLIDEGDEDSGSVDVDLVAEEYAQDEALHPEREERDLDHVLDELLEENAAPMTVSAEDEDLDVSGSAESAESEEERETEEMTEDGKKTSDSLEYSANEDVDNEVLFEDRDDEDFDPLFDYSENDEDSGFDDEPVAGDNFYSLDAEDKVDSAVDQEDQLIAEEDELQEAEYSDREEKYSDRDEDTADVSELAEEAAQYDDVVETAETAETAEIAEIAETAEADEDSVPDFDDELEADAEPEPSEDDAFAAVDPEDDLDELFDDEDRLRRQAAMEEIEEKESSRGRSWMSWASGAFKRLGAKKSADTIESVESTPEQVHQQQDPVESNADQDQWYEQTEENAQTEYDKRYTEHQEQETVWNNADDQQGLGCPEDGYPEDAYPEESVGRQQGAGSYQEQQLSLDIEVDAQAAEAVAGQQDDGYGRQRRAAPGQATGQSASPYQQQSAFDDGFDQDPYTDSSYEENDDDSNEPSEVLAINVLARQGRRFAGDELLQVLLSSGLRFGEMSIFHRHANGKNGPVLFSVANALNPGTFDLNEISEFTTPGVCFFMTLPNVASNNMLVYEQMLATARHVQQSLDAELKDDNRSVMTAQTMEHYRQRIRDFELQQLKHAHGRR